MLSNYGAGRLLSSLDCKDIKPANPKGNQPGIVIRRTDAPILWLPDAKTQLIGIHFLMLGKRAGGEEGDRGWDSFMALLTQWTWVWANSGRQGRTGEPGVLQSTGSQRVGHDRVTEQQWQQGGTVAMHLPANPEDSGDSCSISGSGRAHGVGDGNPLQYFCLENSMDRKAWQVTVHVVTKSWKWLSDWVCTHLVFKY